MRVNLATRRPFYGKIYAHASPDYCANYGIGEKQIQLALPFENSHCGVYQEVKI